MAHPAGELLSPLDEARLFRWLRHRTIANTFRQTLNDSRLRVMLVLVLTTLFWLGLFLLFLDAFQFLESAIASPGTRDQTVRTIFSVFFASLMFMLVFSTGIILYSSLYRSREVQFLLTIPARSERVFLHKFQEAMLFSSWGFILLGSPMLVAYGLVVMAPWYYYLLLVPFLVSFIYIPGGLGAIACLVIVRWFPRRRVEILLALGAILAVAALALLRSLWSEPQSNLMTSQWFEEMIARLQFSEHRLLPSWWLSTGLLDAANYELSEGFLFFTLTFSNALVCHQTAVWTAARLFRRGFARQQGQARRRSRFGMGWIDPLFRAGLWFLPHQMRCLILKDLRVFRRDPVQWTQFFIFFGLLGLYFLNIRRLSYDISHATWVNMVSFLNVAVVGLILSTFTSRFIYPMISLEGRRFWILGRLPVRRATILWSKFVFALLGSVIPCTVLVLVSDVMLRVMPLVMALHVLVCVLLCLGLSGIAVGLGARMPDLREESPSKIAAGFGGTLNLVLSTIYIAAIVVMTAVPCHFYLAAQQSDLPRGLFNAEVLRFWIGAGLAGSLVLAVVATCVPLWLGLRSFARLEF